MSRARVASTRLRTRSADGTRGLGAALAVRLRPGDVVLLVGDLGAGKTTLAQGIAAGLGVTEHVTSPTFTLVRTYRCSSTRPGAAVHTLLHADVYRLDRLGEVVDLDIGELVEDDAVCVVEWGDVAAPALGAAALTVTLAPGGTDDERWVLLEPGPSWNGRPPLDSLLSSTASPPATEASS
jgi:tRNA threonylcarbamoyladenosine biosynthesis protein TsaE